MVDGLDAAQLAACFRDGRAEGIPTWERARLADLVDIGQAQLLALAQVIRLLSEDDTEPLPEFVPIERPWAAATPAPAPEPESVTATDQEVAEFFGMVREKTVIVKE